MNVIGFALIAMFILTGIAHIIDPTLAVTAETTNPATTATKQGEGPAFYFIIAFFIAMFMLMVRQNRKLLSRYTYKDK